VVRRYTVAPIFYAWAELDAVLRVPAMAVGLPEADWKTAKFFAFSGIGNPSAFLDDLRRWRFVVAGQRSFRDHHHYTPADVQALDRSGIAAGADALLCTEKDIFNLRDSVQTQLPIYACRIRLAVSDGEGLWSAVLADIRRNRPDLRV
jgi:tetraacyldisaccharide 4'-kinase